MQYSSAERRANMSVQLMHYGEEKKDVVNDMRVCVYIYQGDDGRKGVKNKKEEKR